MEWLDWIYYLLLFVLLITGLFINLFGLPGLWLMVGSAAAFAWATDGNYIGFWGLGILLFLALLAELVEFLAGSAGAAAAGASKLAMVGAIIGGLLGGIFLTFIPIPVVSTIVGVCLGAFLGAAAVEVARGKEWKDVTLIGWGAAKGRFWGILSKLAFGVLMLIVAMIAAVPIGGASPTPPPVLPTTSPTTADVTASTEPSPPPADDPTGRR